jgi:hypothetical protein
MKMKVEEVERLLGSFNWFDRVPKLKEAAMKQWAKTGSANLNKDFQVTVDSDRYVVRVKLAFQITHTTVMDFTTYNYVSESIDYFDGNMDEFKKLMKQLQMEEKLAK